MNKETNLMMICDECLTEFNSEAHVCPKCNTKTNLSDTMSPALKRKISLRFNSTAPDSLRILFRGTQNEIVKISRKHGATKAIDQFVYLLRLAYILGGHKRLKQTLDSISDGHKQTLKLIQ